MKLNKNTIILGILLTILIISFSFNLVLTGKIIFQDKPPIKIGGAYALTGFAAEWGEADKNSAILAIEEVNEKGGIHGREIELIIEDTGSDNIKTVSAVNKLINFDSVDVILGPTWLDSFGGAAPLADKKNILMITPSASIDAIKADENFKNVFSTYYRTSEASNALINHLTKTNQKRVVMIFANDPYWQDLSYNIKNLNKDLEIIKNIKVNAKDLDFKTQLTQIKELNPDVIIFGFIDESSQLAFLKQRKEIYPESVLYSTESFEEFTLKDNYKSIIKNTFFASPSKVSDNFINKYKDKFGKDPVFTASNSYDATKIILKAIEETGSTDAEDLRKYLKTHEFNTVTFGKTSFDSIGGVTEGGFVIKNSDREVIDVLE